MNRSNLTSTQRIKHVEVFHERLCFSGTTKLVIGNTGMCSHKTGAAVKQRTNQKTRGMKEVIHPKQTLKRAQNKRCTDGTIE